MNEDVNVIIPIAGIMLPIIISLGAFVMIVFIRKYDNIERLAMIEKGLKPEDFRLQRVHDRSPKWGFLLIGIGIGLLIAYFLDRAYDMEEVAYFSMGFIFGGMGLTAAYLVEEKKQSIK
jgi:hypothetical protein